MDDKSISIPSPIVVHHDFEGIQLHEKSMNKPIGTMMVNDDQ